MAKAEKTSFEPNRYIFDEQWHLRNTGFQKVDQGAIQIVMPIMLGI